MNVGGLFGVVLLAASALGTPSAGAGSDSGQVNTVVLTLIAIAIGLAVLLAGFLWHTSPRRRLRVARRRAAHKAARAKESQASGDQAAGSSAGDENDGNGDLAPDKTQQVM